MFEHLLHTNIGYFFVHTYVTYENVILPNLCYTQKKYDIFFFFFSFFLFLNV